MNNFGIIMLKVSSVKNPVMEMYYSSKIYNNFIIIIKAIYRILCDFYIKL